MPNYDPRPAAIAVNEVFAVIDEGAPADAALLKMCGVLEALDLGGSSPRGVLRRRIDFARFASSVPRISLLQMRDLLSDRKEARRFVSYERKLLLDAKLDERFVEYAVEMLEEALEGIDLSADDDRRFVAAMRLLRDTVCGAYDPLRIARMAAVQAGFSVAKSPLLRALAGLMFTAVDIPSYDKSPAWASVSISYGANLTTGAIATLAAATDDDEEGPMPMA